MADLRVIGRGGGPEDPEDPQGTSGIEQGEQAERLFRLAEALTTQERLFAEAFAAGASQYDALYVGWPSMRAEGASAKAAMLRSLYRRERVKAYIEAVRGFGCFSAAFDYEEELLALKADIDDPSTPAHVREKLRATLLDHLWKNGVAARCGYQGGGRALTEKNDSGAVSREDQDAFLKFLGAHAEIPEADTG